MGLSEKHLAVVIMKSFRALIYSQFIPKQVKKIISLRPTKLYILYKE